MNDDIREMCKPGWQAAIFRLSREHRSTGGAPGLGRVLFVMRELARYAQPLEEDSERWVEGMIYTVESYARGQDEPIDLERWD